MSAEGIKKFANALSHLQQVRHGLPEGAFKSSGTGVQSIYVVVDKPSDD